MGLSTAGNGHESGSGEGIDALALPAGRDAACVRWYVAYLLSLRHLDAIDTCH